MRRKWQLGFVVAVVSVMGACFRATPSKGGGEIPDAKAEAAGTPSAFDVDLPDGYRIELVARGLTFPTGVAFGGGGAIYVTEAGYSYGEVTAEARLLEIDPAGGGVKREIARGAHAPWTGVAFHDGALYVAQGGAQDRGRVVRFELDGRETILVDGLPSLGDHHTNGPLVVDGWVYFGQGTATNSGVVGPDNHEYGWLKRQPAFHDTPCRDVKLAGLNFASADPLTPAADDKATTGAFQPFRTPSKPGQVVEGATKCNGAVLRVRPDGSGLEVVAWGFRNPFGLAAAGDGTIYVAENGFDVRGSRAVFGAGDPLWRLEPGAWYGWPDHAAGRSVTSGGHDEADGDPKGALLAANPGEPPRPVAILGVHSSANGLDIARGGRFGHDGDAFVALFGDMAHVG